MLIRKASRLVLFSAIVCIALTEFSASQAWALAQASSDEIAGVTPRIMEPVNESKLTVLPGNVPRVARSEFDKGEAAPSTQLTHIRLILSRSAAQQAALNKYLAELQDQSSPNYHKWLTPQQYGKLYGPADSDIATIVAWVESHGLKLEEVPAGRTNIAFSGTLRQVEEAFHTRIHSFEMRGERFYSNITDPKIPAALAPVVSGVAHLNTIRPRPLNQKGGFGMTNADNKRPVLLSDAVRNGARPDLTLGSGTGSDPYFLFLVAGDAATIYDTPNAKFNSNYTSATSYDGSGVTIGIGGDSSILPATVVDYRTLFVGDSTAPEITNIDGVGATDSRDEAYVDTELSGALAPGATIHFYPSIDLVSGIQEALTENTVDIFSLSFGYCENGNSASFDQMIEGFWEQAAGQGIAVTVSTGDSGSAGCDDPDSSTGDTPDAVQGLQVSGYASTPYNIAVGGTDFYALTASTFSTYASTSASTSSDLFRSALKYIPESPWNDSTTINTTISADVPLTGTDANIIAGAGGKSNCGTRDATTGVCMGYPKPAWQRGAGVPSDGVRDLPDISLMAGYAHTAGWLICTDDTGTSGGVSFTANCTKQSNGNTYFGDFGGTSTSAPAFAGILAQVQQKTGSRLGQAAKTLYDLYNGSHAAQIFHDTVVGNNSVPCTSGTPDCILNAAGNYFESGYDTTIGYDLASGIGSVDATQLVTYWGSAIGAGTSTVHVTPTPTTVAISQNLTVAVTVAGSGSLGTPTGTVTLSDGTYVSAAEPLASGAYIFTIPASDLSVGLNTLTVTYSGDPNYATTTGTATVTVVAPVISLSANSLTFVSTQVGSSAAKQVVTLQNTGTETLDITSITITGANSSSFSDTTTCAATLAISASCTITVTFAPTAAGTLVAAVSLADNAAASPQTIALTGTGFVPAPIVSLSPSSLTFAAAVGASSAVQTVTVKNTGTAALTVTGVSVTGTNASSFTETNNCTSVAISATCAINVTFTPTAFGALTAAVSIADNAANSPQSITLAGTGSEAGTVTLSATAVTVAPGASGTSTISATGTGGYNGSPITLNSCVLTTSPQGSTDAPTCTISSATVTTATTPTTGSITISTTAAAAVQHGNARHAELEQRNKTRQLWGASGATLASLLLLGVPACRRNWRRMLGVLICAAAFGILAGCGGGGGGTKDPGTSAGSYVFTVSGTDVSGAKETVTVNVTVN